MGLTMASRVSDYKNDIYHRDYSNDVTPQTNLVKRIVLAAIPFLSLHSSMKMPVSIAMGSLRIWNSKTHYTTVIAVAAVAASIFNHRVGILLTVAEDFILEAKKLENAKTREEAATSLVKIVNNIVYLTLMSQGGLELAIAASLLQAAVNLLQSKKEFKSGRWIEGVANLLMTGVRFHQALTQVKQLRRNWEIESAIKKIPVGRLKDKWQFPSDHLPMGAEVNGIKIISWNVLNSASMFWVTKYDTQGLNGSMLSDLHVTVNDAGLTKRDVAVTDMIVQMMNKGEVIALQECGEAFIGHLQERLPSNWELVRGFATPHTDQEVILYNRDQLTYQPQFSETNTVSYPSAPGRPIQNAYFSVTNRQDMRIINAHIPGDPQLPCRQEFTDYVQNQHREGTIMVALGDNNFERHEMIEAYRNSGFTDFSIHTPWKSNVDPTTKQSKAIDHLFVIGADSSRDLSIDEVHMGGNLSATIDLLDGLPGLML